MTGLLSLHQFDNVGQTAARRSYPGLARKSDRITERLSPRQCRRFALGPEDLLSVSGAVAYLLVFDAHGRLDPRCLDCSQTEPLPGDRFDAGELAGWVTAHGGQLPEPLPAVRLNAPEPVILKAASPCTVWVVLALSCEDLIATAAPGLLEVTLKPAQAGPLHAAAPGTGRAAGCLHRAPRHRHGL